MTPGSDAKRRSETKKLSHREIWALIWASYLTIMPKVFLFCLLLLLFTFFVTEVLF